jgi:HD-GYP domain-containing protein (c-di-GMP phosphodiesterase class II)
VHDVGKLAIPAEVLAKPGRLTPMEMEIARTHSRQGYEILRKSRFSWPLAEIVLQHHERWDGSGYPDGLRGEQILLEARIIAVADVVEAMSSPRPYRPPRSLAMALAEIEAGAGIRYDSRVAAVCLELFRQQGYTLIDI